MYPLKANFKKVVHSSEYVNDVPNGLVHVNEMD
jgi:hypothetical protein